MKRFFITLAVVLMALPAINAQSKDGLKALKDLTKAKETVAKKNDASSWLKLGNAYAAAFDAPINGLFLNNSQAQTNLLLKGAQKLSSAEKEYNGNVFTVDSYTDKDIYYNNKGILSGYKVTKPVVEGEDMLAKVNEAYEKARELGATAKELKPLYELLARRHWTNAMCAYNLGDFKDASFEFEKSYIVNANPMVQLTDTNAILYAGIAAVQGKDSRRAVELFEKCRSLNLASTIGDIYAYLADCYKSLGDTIQCKAILAEGFEKHPTNQGILVSLINTYLETNDNPDKILSVIHQAQANEPKNASLVYAEGNLYKNMKQYDKCIELYRKAGELDPSYVYAPYNEGDTYYLMALELQEQASMELDDSKYEVMVNQMKDCLKKAIAPFERAFSITDDIEIKCGCAQYLKQIYFHFREESAENMANYEKYNKFLAENESN